MTYDDEARADDFFSSDDEVEGTVEQGYPAPVAGVVTVGYPAPRAAKVRPLESAGSTTECPNCSGVLDPGSRFCPGCGVKFEMGTDDRLAQMQERVLALEAQVNRLSGALNQHADVVNGGAGVAPLLPRTNLLSSSFWTRAFAVYGHSLAVGMLFAIPMWLVGLFFAAVVQGLASAALVR